MFNHFPPHVVFEEVPDEVTLAFVISGCPLRCSGCHSQDTWQRDRGLPLTCERFSHYIEQYSGFISCVLFFGGEWQSELLIKKLIIAKQYQLKTCLYTGLNKLPKRILQHLDFVKTGPWLEERGGLADPKSNQQFIEVSTGKKLNHRFYNH
ncbi:anaerobic ribonucleoside-triphosphate reductase activating protein [Thalassotalea sp. M1531]|uniref:Anaerobic ribonucleoside-triphosphate reductase activating protein n=1 Tax=Thalassotalea algicola TaxID=2716224 RepID=A0A7Y0LDT5_9GAMM|nr:anaerobic ribonucleoside-triphosphate reductase activating protein [Thalassotalea algicola]NMP32363.1 anaerobic ribonucleoside-triphosphate reductase activating protein [Thalassotalea algicola]